MKYFILILAVVITGLSACEKSVQKQQPFPDGNYFGTFQRNLITEAGQKANISITFSSGIWTGQSDIPNYPALCRGTYTLAGDKINFKNECAWTAEFDWSLILSGEYNFTFNENDLTFTKENNNSSATTFKDVFSVSLPKSGLKKSPLEGIWVESESKKDTIIFSPEYDGQFPVLNLHREFRVTEGFMLPGYFSGPYWYILGDNSISLNWFLSSSTLYNRYYFKQITGENEFTIGNFFTDPLSTVNVDTLTFIRIK